MDVKLWEREFEQALQSYKLKYRPIYSDIALVSPRPPAEKGFAADMMIAMEREFWRRVCLGEGFGDTERVNSKFGVSIENNYGVQHGPFIDLATTYWTFKLEMEDILPEYYDTWLWQSLIGIEYRIRVLFFPSPGPMSMPKSMRKKAQKEYLQNAAPGFKIEKYLKENPMLKGWFS